MKSKNHRLPGGFSLVEILVVIVIVIVVAGLALTMSQKAMISARGSKETDNLHQAGLALNVHVAEAGRFPVGWNAAAQISWADLIIKDQFNGELKPTQMPMFWSPLLVKDVPANLDSEAVTHFAANPAIMTEGADDGTGTVVPKFTLLSTQLTRPAEQIVLCGAVSKSAAAPYRASHPVLWEMEAKIGGPSTDGKPPQLDPDNANSAISFPADATKKENFGSMPDFFRYGNRKGQFFFADGHVESMTPADHREKNWAVSY